MRRDKWPGLMVIICLAFKNQIAFIGYTNDPNDLLLSFAALCQLLSLSSPKTSLQLRSPLGLCRQVLTSKALRAIRGNILRSAQLSLTSFWELSSVEGI